MRTKLVVGNWKLNFTNAEANAAVESFIRHVAAKSTVDVVLCPTYVSLPRVREMIRDTHVKLGAQDVFWVDKGAFTGKVSAPMLYDLGVGFCIVGHSETRGRFGMLEIDESLVPYFAETDHTVNLKIKSLLYHSINPILCVGETMSEHQAGQTDNVVREQLARALDGVDPAELYSFVVAYEPVWAIGTGEVCSPEEANRMAGLIRAALGDLLDADVASEIRVLYGGSLKAANCQELFKQPEIDGGLVGGASLDPHEFSRIVMSA